MRKRLVIILPVVVVMALIVIIIALSGGGGSSINTIGSNTLTPLSSVWAEEFMKTHDVSIAVSGPGSGAGFAALINGTTDICQASRSIRQQEFDLAQANGVHPIEIPVAIDALAVVVHLSNPVSELTFAQLSAIYTGEITNWKEVGGNDLTIVAIARNTQSGTHVFFKEHVVQMQGLLTEDKELEYGGDVLMQSSTAAAVRQVEDNPRAIFYSGLGFVTEEVKSLAIKRTPDSPAVLPSVQTALDGTYPIARPLLFYTDGEPTGVVKDFIDYCLSPEGQEKVIEIGYVPLQPVQ